MKYAQKPESRPLSENFDKAMQPHEIREQFVKLYNLEIAHANLQQIVEEQRQMLLSTMTTLTMLSNVVLGQDE